MYEMTDQELEAAFDRADQEIKAEKEEAQGREIAARIESEYDDDAADAYAIWFDVKHEEDLIVGPVPQPTTAFMQAVIDYEVARDDYYADQFRQTRMRRGSRPSAWGPTIARTLAQDVDAAAVRMAKEALLVYGLGPDLLLDEAAALPLLWAI